MATRPGRPFVLGLCGAQGCGKSTLATILEARLEEAGVRATTLSLDDLYLPRDERAALARAVHPLLATRGPPGTHDAALGLDLFDRLARGEAVRLPRFDKARDTRAETRAWPLVEKPDVLIFEGWCVGARSEAASALATPVNALEACEDRDGVWRSYVNAALAGPYSALFARIDRLALLAAPDFGVVADWRIEQERALQARLAAEGCSIAGTMNDAAVRRFVLFYERLTRHILRDMPAYADIVIRLDAGRRTIG